MNDSHPFVSCRLPSVHFFCSKIFSNSDLNVSKYQGFSEIPRESAKSHDERLQSVDPTTPQTSFNPPNQNKSGRKASAHIRTHTKRTLRGCLTSWYDRQLSFPSILPLRSPCSDNKIVNLCPTWSWRVGLFVRRLGTSSPQWQAHCFLKKPRFCVRVRDSQRRLSFHPPVVHLGDKAQNPPHVYRRLQGTPRATPYVL